MKTLTVTKEWLAEKDACEGGMVLFEKKLQSKPTDVFVLIDWLIKHHIQEKGRNGVDCYSYLGYAEWLMIKAFRTGYIFGSEDAVRSAKIKLRAAIKRIEKAGVFAR